VPRSQLVLIPAQSRLLEIGPLDEGASATLLTSRSRRSPRASAARWPKQGGTSRQRTWWRSSFAFTSARAR